MIKPQVFLRFLTIYLWGHYAESVRHDVRVVCLGHTWWTHWRDKYKTETDLFLISLFVYIQIHMHAIFIRKNRQKAGKTLGCPIKVLWTLVKFRKLWNLIGHTLLWKSTVPSRILVVATSVPGCHNVLVWHGKMVHLAFGNVILSCQQGFLWKTLDPFSGCSQFARNKEQRSWGFTKREFKSLCQCNSSLGLPSCFLPRPSKALSRGHLTILQRYPITQALAITRGSVSRSSSWEPLEKQILTGNATAAYQRLIGLIWESSRYLVLLLGPADLNSRIPPNR